MGERLKEIWTGFASQTERRLTGKGVDNIIVPHRADYEALDREFLPDDYESPAERAFATLRADLSRKEKLFSGKDKQATDTKPASVQMRAESVDFDEKAWGKDDLNVGLYSTALRTERTEIDYERFMDTDAGRKALKRGRKKFLGIF